MAIRGTTQVRCSGCGAPHTAELVQSINTRAAPGDKDRLLAGALNVLACPCGARTQLAAHLLFHDPDADYLCQVAPGGPAAVARAQDGFLAAGATGITRIVPSLNALVEKVKLLDAGLEDWAIEMVKVLLLASVDAAERDLDRVLLFDALDRDAGVLHWLLFDDRGDAQRVASPLAAYTKLASRTHGRPGHGERQVDRAWAVEAVRAMIAAAN